MIKDFTRMASKFHDSCILPNGLNSSFIALIPKCKQPKLVSDFRPISLINCSLKILLKTLANRLRNSIGSLNSEEQSAFMRGRNISDSVMVVSEVAHSLQSKEEEGFILKLDFEKAFDLVSLEFLLHAMDKFGLGQKWNSWMLSIMTSARMSVLVNVSPTQEFSSTRGIRQGDPLSSLLFNLVGEILHLILEKAANLGIIQGIALRSSPCLTHLQFADDSIIFLKGSYQSCRGIKVILKLFELLSGLKINYQKSHLYAARKNLQEATTWANIIGCQRGTWPFNYLGVPVGASPKRKKFWVHISTKVKTKPSAWKCSSLNKQGRSILIKPTLNSLPLYWMNFFSLPKGVIKEIDLTRRRFFWGEMQGTNVTT